MRKKLIETALPLDDINKASRRIDDTNRLVCSVENDNLIIRRCKGHYGD